MYCSGLVQPDLFNITVSIIISPVLSPNPRERTYLIQKLTLYSVIVMPKLQSNMVMSSTSGGHAANIGGMERRNAKYSGANY